MSTEQPPAEEEPTPDPAPESDQEAEQAPAPRPEPKDWSTVFAPTDEFKARIATMMRDVPTTGEDESTWDDVAERRREIARTAWRNSLNFAYVPELADTTLADLEADQKPKVLRQYVDHIGPDAKVLNLVIAGRVGAGKTAAAVAAGNAAVERGLMARFVRHSQYVAMLRPEGSPSDLPDWQIRRRFRDCDLLILDDLGAGLDTDKEASRFVVDETLGLLGDRISAGKATITTTNEKAEALTVMFTERVLSRLSEHGLSITLKHPDRRGRLSW